MKPLDWFVIYPDTCINRLHVNQETAHTQWHVLEIICKGSLDLRGVPRLQIVHIWFLWRAGEWVYSFRGWYDIGEQHACEQIMLKYVSRNVGNLVIQNLADWRQLVKWFNDRWMRCSWLSLPLYYSCWQCSPDIHIDVNIAMSVYWKFRCAFIIVEGYFKDLKVLKELGIASPFFFFRRRGVDGGWWSDGVEI